VAGSAWALQQQPVADRVMDLFRVAAITHRGNVRTPGYGYWLLDPHFYTRRYGTDVRDYNRLNMEPAEVERFAIRAAASFFIVPLPWKAESRSALALVPQQLAWYGLAALAAAGLLAGWRRDAVFTWLLAGNVLLGAAAVSLFNGNVGTLVRMRDSVVPVMMWLSAVGGCAVLEWTARRFSEGPQHGPA
jgi:hypothetical protein